MTTKLKLKVVMYIFSIILSVHISLIDKLFYDIGGIFLVILFSLLLINTIDLEFEKLKNNGKI